MSDNVDQAKACIKKAEEALLAGDYDKATRFVEKSLRFHRSAAAEKLSKRISIEKSKSSQSKNNREQADSPARDSSSSSKRPTQENSTKGGRDDLVDRIKRAKDHYQVLGIDKSASDDDVKKAYRKLALKLHPDKNKTPGAEEAFKNVSKAFTVLSDPVKRESYDRHGMDDEQMQQYSARRGAAAAAYTSDIDPDELFRQFFGVNVQRHHFGGGFPNAYYYHTRHTHNANNGSRERRQGAAALLPLLIQLLPIIFILLTAIPFPSEAPAYQLERSGSYSVPQKTEWKEVPYYVQPEFSKKFDSYQKRRIEEEVEMYYKRKLESECNYQKHLQRSTRSRKGHQIRTPSCDILREKFYSRYQKVR